MFKNYSLISQYARFAAVGITSLIVDYVFMVFFTENTAFGLNYFQACAFSYTLSVFVNYFLSMRYVFHGREDMGKVKEASIFFMLQMFYIVAKLLSTFLVTNYNFISRKKFFE